MNKNIYKLILVAIILLIFLINNPYKIIIVQGNSMFPTYKNNQILLARKTVNLRKNDVVVLCVENEIILKRVIYTEGESIYYYFDDEKYYVENDYESVHNFLMLNNGLELHSMRVPKNYFYVLGDNKNESDDSRRFGLINRRDIFYKVID